MDSIIEVIPDSELYMIWECHSDECECANRTCAVHPTFYEDSGTPMCECDSDMVYIRTERRYIVE